MMPEQPEQPGSGNARDPAQQAEAAVLAQKQLSAAAEQVGEAGVAPQKPRSPRVLLAEDDPGVRRLLAAILRKDGWEVVEARDGYGVIDYIGMCAIVGGGLNLDLVISDIHMAGADGLRILSGLHSHDPRLPVILITAYGNPEVEAEAMRRGALAVLEKPFDVDQLLALLRQRLQREQPAPPS